MLDNEINNKDLNKPFDTEDVLSSAEVKQRKIRDAFIALDIKMHELNKELAGIYEGMVLTFNNKRNPDRMAQVSHSARELTAILPRYFQGIPILEIDKSQTRTNQNNAKHREVLKDLLNKHPDRSVLPEYLRDKFVDDWMDVHMFFIKTSKHENLKNQTMVDVSIKEKEFESYVWKYEDLLYQVLVERTFFDGLAEIDKLLKISTPLQKDISELAKNISQPEHRRYFFQRCDNSNWLDPLKKIGAFSKPQEAIREAGYIRFIDWPESQYLLRIANKEPDKVFEIIKDLNSDNQSVLNDFVDAAIRSPAQTASKYVDLIDKKKWIQNPYNFQLPDKIADLMNKLAREGDIKGALRLARILFDTKINQPKISHNTNISFSNSKPHFDEWMFDDIMKNKINNLANNDPCGLFGVFSTCLRQALDLEGKTQIKDGFYDFSHIWRPNLGRAKNTNEDIKNILLDGLINLIDENKNKPRFLASFIEILHRHRFGVFRRVEIYVYLLNPTLFKKQIEELLTDKKTVIAYNLRREYLPLLEKEYKNLSVLKQQEIIKIINEGPDFVKNDDMADRQSDRIREHWKMLYFASIKEFLPPSEKRFYDGAIAKYGEIKDDDGEIHTWNGGQSPIKVEELSVMNCDKVLEYLNQYQIPDDPFDRYSSGGLGIMFAGLVTSNPLKYILLASQLIEKKVRPIFLYHFINGLKEALKQGKCFGWNSVIDFFHDIVINNKTLVSISKPANQDEPDWNSVLQAISDFMSEALGKSICEIPINLKNKVWVIISVLADDPEPTPEDEKRESNFDPINLALNTIRGKAMHAAINYGLWVARNESNKKTGIKITSEAIKLFNKHLDISQDPSFAVRSVYGWRLPNLFYLNKPWLEANKEKIFPKDSPDYLFAAWGGYLANQVIKEVFSLLKQQYREFIPYLGAMKKKGYYITDIEQRFSQHVVIIYANEIEHDDFVNEFFELAPVKSRAEAINFCGRVILRQLNTLKNKEEVKKRLANLWTSRITITKDKIDTEELLEFGWWFENSPFNRKETLEQMIKTLEITKGEIDIKYKIIEELTGYASEFPVESIKILDLVSRSESDPHTISYKKDECREVIKLVKGTKVNKAVKIADKLINYLGSKGFIEFRELL